MTTREIQPTSEERAADLPLRLRQFDQYVLHFKKNGVSEATLHERIHQQYGGQKENSIPVTPPPVDQKQTSSRWSLLGLFQKRKREGTPVPPKAETPLTRNTSSPPNVQPETPKVEIPQEEEKKVPLSAQMTPESMDEWFKRHAV